MRLGESYAARGGRANRAGLASLGLAERNVILGKMGVRLGDREALLADSDVLLAEMDVLPLLQESDHRA
jgi:hypothetical protein